MNSQSKSILLAEDNPMDLDLSLRAFARGGVANSIEVARDGEEVLAWIPRWEAGEKRPAFILLDIAMPRVSGLEVLRTLKAHEFLNSIPVIMMTTSGARQDMRAAYAAGANSYVIKPVDYDEFETLATQIVRYWVNCNRYPD